MARIPDLSRRKFFEKSSRYLAGMTTFAPAFGLVPAAMGQGTSDPHFLLLLVIPGGIDTSYLFDARPLSHSAAKLQTNYLEKPSDPDKWTGINGNTTLVTDLVGNLKKYRPYFSILNGVLMADNFDGHDQNTNFLLTGSAFGGDWFGPYINGSNQTSIDALALGALPFADMPTNGARSLGFSINALKNLVAIKGRSSGLEQSPIHRLAVQRAQMLGSSSGSEGLLSKGAKDMFTGLSGSPELEKRIQNIKLGDQKGVKEYLDACHQIFAAGLSKTVMIDLKQAANVDGDLDAHSLDVAKGSPAAYKSLMAALGEIFEYLIQTPFQGTKKSLMDVTTVMMTSEFTRTTRQIGTPFAESGTDHNPLSNTVILAGKGIRGNLILGRSDLAQLAAGNTAGGYEKVSGAHRSLDAELIKKMGMPFDHKSLQVVDSLPETFVRSQYLTIEHVVNSVIKAFGVTDKALYRPLAGDRTLTPALILEGLLKKS